jgi:tetratricopeptide (TPR) repeat protein
MNFWHVSLRSRILSALLVGSTSLLAGVLLALPALAQSGGYSIDAAVSYQSRGDNQGLYKYGLAWTHAEPQNGKAWFALGKGAAGLGRDQEAAQAFLRTTQLMPDQGFPYNELAASYSKIGEAQLAIKAIDDGEAKAGANFSARDWYIFGNARKTFRQFDRAVVDYRKAIAMAPDSNEAWNNLGIAYQMEGDNADALKAYNRAAALGNQMAAENAATLQAAIDQQARAQANQYNGQSFEDYQAWKGMENKRRANAGEELLK